MESTPEKLQLVPTEQPSTEKGPPTDPRNPAECAICLEFFAPEGERAPMSLHCGHSLCRACCDGIQGEPTEWNCPICRNITRCKDLRPNFSLIEQLETLRAAGDAERSMCEECDLRPATLYCDNCQASLCTSCKESTHQSKIQKKHTVRPVCERPATDDVGVCAIHRQPLRYMCLQDKAVRCGDCIHYGDCKGHDHDLVLNVAASYREELTAAMEVAMKADAAAQAAAAKAELVCQEIGTDCPRYGKPGPCAEGRAPPSDAVVKDARVRGAPGERPRERRCTGGSASVARAAIRKEFANLCAILEEREAKLLCEVDDLHAGKLAVLEDHVAKIGTHRSEISTAVYRATNACNSTDTELCSQYGDCLVQLQRVGAERAWVCPTDASVDVEFDDVGPTLQRCGGVTKWEPMPLTVDVFAQLDPQQKHLYCEMDAGWWADIKPPNSRVVDGVTYSPKECCLRALEMDPNVAEAWFRLGCCGTCVAYGGGGEGKTEVGGITYSEMECFERALEIDPSHADAWFWLSGCFHPTGAKVGGVAYGPKECVQRALEMDPGLAGAWSNLGRRFNGGEVGGITYSAKECLLHALEIDPGHARAWCQRSKHDGGNVGGVTYSAKECNIRALEIDPEDSCKTALQAWSQLEQCGGGMVGGVTYSPKDIARKYFEVKPAHIFCTLLG